MEDNILWIFIHPIRSGGNTLIEFIRVHAPKETIFMASNFRYGQKNFLPFDSKKTRFALGHATYYGMHKLSPKKESRYFTFLRDPAKRVISYYNAKMQETGKRIPFEKWYKGQMKNDLVHFLDLKYRGEASTRTPAPKIFMPIIKRLNYNVFFFLQTIVLKFMNKSKKEEMKKLENAKKLLDLCWFVGIVENSKEDFKFLFRAMGFKNPKWNDDRESISKKILKLDDELRKKIYKENPLDFEIYQYALKVRKEKLEQIKKQK